jgi:hypothetical protein
MEENMAGRTWASALAAAFLVAGSAAPTMAQYYYPPQAPPGYYGGGGGYYGGGGGYYRPRRVAMSRVCATDAGVCYQRPQQIGTWCKCGGGPTRATGSIVPE